MLKKIVFILFIILILYISFINVNANTNIQKNNNIISDGRYRIVSAVGSNRFVDIEGSSTNNCANVGIWENTNGNNQKFDIVYGQDGFYEIKAVHSGKLLDVEGSSKKIGTNVLQYSKNNANGQKWTIKDAGNGYYYFISKCNGLYLDVNGGSSSMGTNIQVWSKNECNSQKFKLLKVENEVGKKTIENGIYEIKSKLNNNVNLNIDSAKTTNCANLNVWKDTSSQNQKFKVIYEGNGYYEIIALHSNKLLDVEGSSQLLGTNVLQYSKNNANGQKWIIKETSEKGYYNIISKCNNLYLDINASSTKNGNNVHVWEKNNSNNQKFKFTNILETTDSPMYGIDVSSWQGEIDWNKVKNSGIKFVMIRARL